jgi:oxygen-independent coproporphyrinogen-3 oxidase
MAMTPDLFDAALVRKYDRPGPRYTSYPSAPQFTEAFDDRAYRDRVELSNGDPIPRPLSIYVHVPFCQSLCFYCACNKIITRNRDKAARYLEYLKREIALQGELFDGDRPVIQLHLGGGTPTYLDERQVADLMTALGVHFQIAEGAECSVEVDPRTVGPAQIEVLAGLGFNRLSFGVQDFDPDVQHAVNRVQTEQQTAELISAARRHHFHSVSVDLIYGLPKQTPATFEATLDKVLGLEPDRLAVYNYAHLPQLFKAQRLIRTEDLPSPETKLALLGLTIERLTGAGYAYIGMDHFARAGDGLARALQEGTLQRNFQGYSTHADTDLIGLGVTGIGSVGGSYSQNLRHLNAYYERLDAGRLPVFRGLVLSDDDLLRRELINTLMCRGRLDFRAVEKRHGICFARAFRTELRRLEPMAADGLLMIGADFIELRPLGRLMLRNVCMVFDRYLQPRPQQFSRTV